MDALVCRWDPDGPFEPFPHFWEHSVGSDHAPVALRADWQEQMRRAHGDLGFRYARFHGILSDDMGTLVCERNKFVDSFYNSEKIFDFLISIGMRPFVELSFMPSALASGGKTVFRYRGNVTPPKDLKTWADFIKRFAGNCVKRYGADEVSRWLFEVWNEPNLDGFWTGSERDYLEFYRATAEALRQVDPGIKVGGPATAMNAWIDSFVDFCRGRDVPVDFVSTHHYPTDAFGKPGDDTLTQLAESRRGVLREQAREAKSRTRGLPLYYTEWCTSSNPFDDLHDRPYASAFITKTVFEARGLVQGYSYWTFSDLFEENYFDSTPFHGGFGLQTVDGVAKPAYRAFELLHRAGDEIHASAPAFPTVDAWLTRRGNQLRIFASNSQLPRHPVKTETLRLELPRARVVRSTLERIDDRHANARARWEEMGSPSRLMPPQRKELDEVSRLRPEDLSWRDEDGTAVAEISIPPQGVLCATVEVA